MASKFVFNNEDAVVASAQQIVASRIQFKVETDNPFKLNKSAEKSVEALKTYLALNMAHFELEHLHALYFDGGGKLIKSVEVGIGTNGEVAVNHKEILRQALILNADMAVVAHNHPNQDPTPSPQDVKAMQSISDALNLFDIQLILAFVVAGPTPDKVVPIPPPQDSNDPREMLRRLFGEGIVQLG